jgi:hypothetical protein
VINRLTWEVKEKMIQNNWEQRKLKIAQGEFGYISIEIGNG